MKVCDRCGCKPAKTFVWPGLYWFRKDDKAEPMDLCERCVSDGDVVIQAFKSRHPRLEAAVKAQRAVNAKAWREWRKIK